MSLLIDLARRVPLDLGQRHVAHRTKGKKIALSLLPQGAGRHALDVGAREGNQTRLLRGLGYRVTSIDLTPQFAECERVDANDGLPFGDESFDLVWCSEVIEHLLRPEHFLHELRRVTRSGGEIILTTPNSYAWLFRFIALFGFTPQRIQRKEHLHFFGIENIRTLAPDATVYGYFPYAFVKLTIRHGVGALSPTFVLHIRT